MSGMQAQDITVAWVTPGLGVRGDLLYWGPILQAYYADFPKLKILTALYDGDVSDLPLPVEMAGKLRYHYQPGQEAYASGYTLVGPSVIKRLWQLKPDLIIISEYSLLSLYGIIARAILRTPRILLLSEARPKLFGSAWLAFARKLMRRFITGRADIILTNNEDGKAYLVEELNANPKRVIARPYLVSVLNEDLATTHLATAINIPERLSPNNCVFLFVGLISVRKGVQCALDACRHLLKQGVTDFEFWVVGDGPARQTLEQQAHAEGLTNNVRFLGKKPYEHLASFCKATDVFLFPTLCDYRSLAAFEALSMGMPILCSREDGGVFETVEDGKNGFSFDPKDSQMLASHMQTLVQNPELRMAFAEHSRELAKSFTLEVARNTLRDVSLATLECARS